MKPLTGEWIKKAEADYTGALDLRATRRVSNRDLVCYHCQQAAEKYLKAYLTQLDAEFPRTHDLRLLLKLIEQMQPLWASLADPLAALTTFAVEVRYPGAETDARDVREAVKITERVRAMVLDALGAQGRTHKPPARRRRK